MLHELIAGELASASQAPVDAEGGDETTDLAALLCAACQDLIGNAGAGQH
jgi:hypothetical protein